MAVLPTAKSTFTSTVWNSPGRANHSTNAAKFGGPNVAISEGSKVQFGDGDNIWDVARVFNDGTLYLVTTTTGRRITRRIPPSDPSWTNLWMVDGKRFRTLSESNPTPPKVIGGGPDRNLDPGNVILVGASRVRWVVDTVDKDGTVHLVTVQEGKTTYMSIDKGSRFWNSMYPVSR